MTCSISTEDDCDDDVLLPLGRLSADQPPEPDSIPLALARQHLPRNSLLRLVRLLVPRLEQREQGLI